MHAVTRVIQCKSLNMLRARYRVDNKLSWYCQVVVQQVTLANVPHKLVRYVAVLSRYNSHPRVV